MNNPKISIIVPVYNGEKYLEKCVDSIVHQTERDIEVILVDNGSLDLSGEMCDAFAEKDNRIKVIHQPNNGVSFARNTGIENAKGDYIGFVDADDWIDIDMYDSLLKEASRSEADVVMCDATTVYSNGETQADTITQLTEDVILQKSDFIPPLLLEMAGSACRCIYRKRLFNNCRSVHPLIFPFGVKFSEDRIFNLYAFGYANKVVYKKKSYYNRYVNKDSAVHRFHSDYFDAVKKAHYHTQKALDIAWDGLEELKTAYLNQFVLGAFSAINNYYYKTSTLSKSARGLELRKICTDTELINAIYKLDCNDIRAKWILNKKYLMLKMYAKLYNLKNKY